MLIHSVHRFALSPCVLTLAGLAACCRAGEPDEPGRPTAQTVFNVLRYGAAGKREEKATAAIQRAIDAAEAAGGGTVSFPPGQYTSGTVHLKSNVTLQLDAGATLLASRDPADYKQFGDNPATRLFPILIAADGATGVSVCGRGTIDGQAEYTYENFKHSDPLITEEIAIARRAGLPIKRWYRVPPFVCLIYLTGCRHVLVEGVRLLNSPGWSLTARGCENVRIHGLYVANNLEKATNSDGIDLVSCRNASVSGCTVETGDDAICLKSGLFPGPAIPCENIIVSDCICTSTSAALKLGSDSHGGFRAIRFHHCVVRNANRGLCVDLRDGGRTSDVVFSDITLECNRKDYFWWGSGEAISVVVSKRLPESPTATIEGLVFRNISARCQGTSRLAALPGGPRICDVTLDNVRLRMEAEGRPDKRTTDALQISGAERLTLRNVEISWDQRQTEPKWQAAIRLRDVGRLEMDGVAARQGLPSGPAAAVEIEGVGDGVVRHCRALPGATTFLRIADAPKGGLWIAENEFRAAALGVELPKERPTTIRLERNCP
ncbi:MAG: glycoside hydrolase family 28 protein [Thermoguttaceae bacterium]